jgi:hypothetical protein
MTGSSRPDDLLDRMSRVGLFRVFCPATSLALAALSAGGLVSALLGDGVWDLVSWLGFASPVGAAIWYLLRNLTPMRGHCRTKCQTQRPSKLKATPARRTIERILVGGGYHPLSPFAERLMDSSDLSRLTVFTVAAARGMRLRNEKVPPL